MGHVFSKAKFILLVEIYLYLCTTLFYKLKISKMPKISLFPNCQSYEIDNLGTVRQDRQGISLGLAREIAKAMKELKGMRKKGRGEAIASQ